MDMKFEPEMTVEMAIVQLQNDLGSLKKSNDELRVFILGNGDPKRGLLWLSTNQGELLITLSGLVAAQAKALEKHTENGHVARTPPLGQWLGREAMRQVVVSIVLVIVAVFALGIATFIRNGGHF